MAQQMGKATSAFIDTIVWQSAPRTIGAYQWRAIRYTLPERYGKGLTRRAYQFRRAAQFGSAPELWTDAEEFPAYARYLPNQGLPKQIKTLWDETGDLISDEIAPPITPRRDVQHAKSKQSSELQLGFGF